MPDTRHHRGAHPEDAKLFAAERWPSLQRAAAELHWLLDRGYALRSAVELVGNRHYLEQRQRLALARGACSAAQLQRRNAHRVDWSALASADAVIDGYNLLITLESALSGALILGCRDGTFRDLASLHGTYREVHETEPAARLAGEAFARAEARSCRWILDRPVSNSGRLRTHLLEIAASAGWPWLVELEFSPDHRLAAAGEIVTTSDSVVLDRCARWVNAAREIIEGAKLGARILDLAADGSAS